MMITMLQGKIHRATVTDACLHYEGSVTIDENLIDQAGMTVYQQVQVYNVNTGARFETYAIPGERGSGIIQINGAAAHLAKKDDIVIIAAYCHVPVEASKDHQPQCVYVNAQNQPVPKPVLAGVS